jgi:KDO2-lipid IV(A) lauroyltransferase
MAQAASIKKGLRSFSYWLRYRTGEYCVNGFVAVLPWIPQSVLTGFTKMGAHLTFHLLREYPKRMEKNLSLVMGEEFPTRKERKALVRRAWINFAQGIQETATAIGAPKVKILSTVTFEGQEHLKPALERKKGVIGLSAHLGNFTLIGARLAAEGYPFSVVVKQPKDEGFARLMNDLRLRIGMKTISARPRRVAVRQILKALKENEVVLMVADELKTSGPEVEFFGQRLPVPRGPVTLAMRSGAAILPMFMTRDQENRLTLRISPELDLRQTGALQEDVMANVAMFSSHLEKMVRRYPDQWNWLGIRENIRLPREKVRRLKRKERLTAARENPTPADPRPPL